MKSAIVFAGEISIGFITAAAVFFYIDAEGVVHFLWTIRRLLLMEFGFCGAFVLDCRFCVWIFSQSVCSRHLDMEKMRLFLP